MSYKIYYPSIKFSDSYFKIGDSYEFQPYKGTLVKINILGIYLVHNGKIIDHTDNLEIYQLLDYNNRKYYGNAIKITDKNTNYNINYEPPERFHNQIMYITTGTQPGLDGSWLSDDAARAYNKL